MKMQKKPETRHVFDLWPTLPLCELEALLLPKGYKLLPLVRQKYEFELAAAEAKVLGPREIVERGAYFMSVGGQLTHHYRIAQAAPLQVSPDASETRKMFFESNRFAVAYATHGLFPYRGKFHPQMIKAIINIIGVKPGETILDPMMGSGTTLVEASLMGIHAIGIELNPFTALMSKVKLSALQVDTEPFPILLQEADKIFRFFEGDKAEGYFRKVFENVPDLQGLALLSYLDALAYGQRRKTKKARELFPGLFKRYLEAVESFNKVRQELDLKLGRWVALQSDARKMPLQDGSIDGIVFSPPYSFALDYVENDRAQLEYLSVDVERLKQEMVGLRQENAKARSDIRKRVELYFEDMAQIFRECARVLKKSRYCVVVIGSNTQQTGGIRLEKELIRLATDAHLPLNYHMVREIEGIRNTMKEEHLLFFWRA